MVYIVLMRKRLLTSILLLFTTGLLLYAQSEPTPTPSSSPSPTTASPSPSPNLELNRAILFDLDINWQGQPYSTSGGANTYKANGIAPSPVYPRFGGGYEFKTNRNQYLAFMLLLYFQEYVYREDLGRAFPTQIETGNQTGPIALVMGVLPSAIYRFEFPLASNAILGLGTGIGLNFHIPVLAIDNSSGNDKIANALFGSFKVPMLILETYGRFPVGSHTSFGPHLRVMLPIYHVWDGENIEFWDNLLVSLGLELQLKL